jgi:hypothetical protein
VLVMQSLGLSLKRKRLCLLLLLLLLQGLHGVIRKLPEPGEQLCQLELHRVGKIDSPAVEPKGQHLQIEQTARMSIPDVCTHVYVCVFLCVCEFVCVQTH